jgi:tetratricopeptide (TPR) repeat protein
MSGCPRAPRIQAQQSSTSLHYNKVHRVNQVVLGLIVLYALALFSHPVLGQSGSVDNADSLKPFPNSTSVESRGQNLSPYVVSISHLRVPEKALGHLDAAQKRFAKMELERATVEIDRAIAIYPGFAQAFCMRALVQLAEKDFTGSVESAAHAISLDGADPYSWIALATAFNSLKEWPEAEAAAGQGLALNSLAWQGRLELAKSYYGQGKYTLALSTLEGLRQDIPDIHLVRADSLMRIGHPQEAARQFLIFLQETPGDPRAEQIRQILSQVQAAQN